MSAVLITASSPWLARCGTIDKPVSRVYYETKSNKPNNEMAMALTVAPQAHRVFKPKKPNMEMVMARPRAPELTARELEVMHVFWNRGESTAAEVRETLAGSGRELAYTTVATLIRILSEKEFISQSNSERPFRYRPRRSFDDVSGRLLGDLIKRVFRGSREHLLVRLMEQRKLSAKERAILEKIVREGQA